METSGPIQACNGIALPLIHIGKIRDLYKISVANRGTRDCFLCLDVRDVDLMLKWIIKNNVLG